MASVQCDEDEFDTRRMNPGHYGDTISDVEIRRDRVRIRCGACDRTINRRGGRDGVVITTRQISATEVTIYDRLRVQGNGDVGTRGRDRGMSRTIMIEDVTSDKTFGKRDVIPEGWGSAIDRWWWWRWKAVENDIAADFNYPPSS